jgi:hypothetical protein
METTNAAYGSGFGPLQVPAPGPTQQAHLPHMRRNGFAPRPKTQVFSVSKGVETMRLEKEVSGAVRLPSVARGGPQHASAARICQSRTSRPHPRNGTPSALPHPGAFTFSLLHIIPLSSPQIAAPARAASTPSTATSTRRAKPAVAEKPVVLPAALAADKQVSASTESGGRGTTGIAPRAEC